MNTDSEDRSWQDTYRAKDCKLPYEDEEKEDDDARDPAIVTLLR
jgi:hypothetical protein